MPNEVSITAMGSAVLRAAHVREDTPPWVLEDTLSEQLLAKSELEQLQSEIGRWPEEVRAGFRLAHAVRTRLAEEVAVEGLAVGRRDYVLLGAGLDTFAWRHPRAGEFKVLEIDHPATQLWKRRRLAEAQLAVPANVRFTSLDLAAAPLEVLGTPSLATWNWLGVTMYLEPPTTAGVLRSIAGKSTGTHLVVNLLLADDEQDELGRKIRSTATAVVAKVGEPVRSSYTREQCRALLQDCGFSSVELFDSLSLAQRYFAGRRDLCLPGSTLLALAVV